MAKTIAIQILVDKQFYALIQRYRSRVNPIPSNARAVTDLVELGLRVVSKLPAMKARRPSGISPAALDRARSGGRPALASPSAKSGGRAGRSKAARPRRAVAAAERKPAPPPVRRRKAKPGPRPAVPPAPAEILPRTDQNSAVGTPVPVPAPQPAPVLPPLPSPEQKVQTH